jgi:hypothetical protein
VTLYLCILLDNTPAPVARFEYEAVDDAEASDLALLRAVPIPNAMAYEVWQGERRVACCYVLSSARRKELPPS